MEKVREEFVKYEDGGEEATHKQASWLGVSRSCSPRSFFCGLSRSYYYYYYYGGNEVRNIDGRKVGTYGRSSFGGT